MLLVAVSIADCPVQIVTELLLTESVGVGSDVIDIEFEATPQDEFTVAEYTVFVPVGIVVIERVLIAPVLHV